MRLKIALRLEPFGAFYAVVFSQSGQVLGSLCALVLIEVLFFVKIGMNLVEIACPTARLLLRVGTSDGGHGAGNARTRDRQD